MQGNIIMTLGEAVKICLTKKYFVISGRATSDEFWEFQVFIILVLAGLIITAAITDWSILLLLGIIFYVIVFIPSSCACIRRLHDAGFSGWFILLQLIPTIGVFILLVMLLWKSDDDNKWGPNPQSTIE